MTNAALPRTEGQMLPPDRAIRRWSPFYTWLLRRWFAIDITGAEHVPSTGPVIIAANHMGFIDGPMIPILSPRPIHVLTKQEMYEGKTGTFLTWAGQIPVDRRNVDMAAVRTCVALLRSGRAVGLFPESERGGGDMARAKGGAAYLAAVTGAPVVPLAILGTREPGGSKNSLPRWRTRVALQYATPLSFPQRDWPRTRAQVSEDTETLRKAMRDNVEAAIGRTGIALPGPIPGE